MMDEYIKKWIIKALEDLKVAKHELCFPEKKFLQVPFVFTVNRLWKNY